MEQVAHGSHEASDVRRALGRMSPRGFDTLLLYPLLIPAVLLAAGNDAFGFDPPGPIDPYVYLGYFWHYPEHLWPFDDNSNYKISRLPWILPGFVAHAMLPPVAAARVLAYCTLSSAAVALYLHLRDAIRDRHAAAFVSVVLACCTWMHGPTGWYYHALMAAGFYLWSCWMVTRAATGGNAVTWATGAGVCYAAAVHTHLFFVVFAPLLVLLYWAALDPARSAQAESRWRAVALSGIAGGVGLTIVLAVINGATGGQWLFFLPQMEQALKVSGDRYWLPVGKWLPGAVYLVLPLAMIVMGLSSAHRPGRAGRLTGILVVLPCLALGIMSFLQFVQHQTTLDYSYLAFPVYLHAFGAAAIAVRCPGPETGWRPVLLGGAVVLLVGLLLLMPAQLAPGMQVVTIRLGLAQAPPIVGPLLFSLAGVLVGRLTPPALRLVVVAGWISFVNVWIAPQPEAYGMGTRGVRQEMLETFREADAFTHRLDPSLIGIKYWISSEQLQTPLGPVGSQAVFDSFVATRAWFTNLFARESPGKPLAELTLDHLSAASCLGILSSREGQGKLAQAMMTHYASLGRPLRVVAERSFERADFGFALTVMKPADQVAALAGEAPPCAPAQPRAP